MATVRRRALVGSLRDERTPIGLMIGMIPSWIISIHDDWDDKDDDDDGDWDNKDDQHEKNDTILDKEHNDE